VTRTIPGFFIPEQYLLFTFIFHFVHTDEQPFVAAAEGCVRARSGRKSNAAVFQ
jgi:hypothetical protein